MSEATETFRLLFVCTGNTCRSPLAEALARRELSERGWAQVEVGSAGVAAFPGEEASDGSLAAARRHGLDLSDHRATRLTETVVAGSDLILTMSPGHVVRAMELGGEGRTALLTAFADHGVEGDILGGSGVPDPFGGDEAAYQAAYLALETLVTQVLNRLEPLVSS